MPLEQSHEPHDVELSVAAARPFDFHAWLATWQREYVFFRIDVHLRINFMAPSVREILGYEPEEMLGRDYREFFDLDHPLQAKLIDLSDRMLSSDPPGQRRCVARRRSGQLAFFSLREREILAPSGTLGREFMAQDVTARVEAELSLRQSERKYRRLVEGLRADYIIYARDAQGMITYVSPSAKRVLGYEPEELVGTYAREVYANVDQGREVIDRFAREAEQGKLLHRFVGQIKHRDGGARTLEIQERPVFAIDGRLSSVEGIAKDVTEAAAAADQVRELTEDLERRVALRTEELSRINEELRASEARYRDVVETQSDFIVRWKPDGTRTFVNEAFARFRGLKPTEMLGASFMPLIHPEDRRTFDEAIASITPSNPTATYEVRNSKTGGGYTPLHWTTRAFFDGAGAPVEYQSVGHDLTALRDAADLLRQKEAHLAHLSRLATMGEMVAGIAHEVSQPLHAAKTFAEAARRNLQSGGPERVQTAIECTAEISYAVTRTVQIIRRLREFTKSQPFEQEPLDLNDVVREAIDLTAYEMRRIGAVLRLELAAASPLILGDRIQLEQLIVNLLINACEAMEETPADERVLQISSFASKGGAAIAIRDAGVGVAESEIHRLFEPFYTTKSEGMGMGLVLCKSIADAHGIDLTFERNQDGPGMTFSLHFSTMGAPNS